jgi:endoglucanase
MKEIRMPIPRVLEKMLRLPTAPFVEHAVVEYVRRACGAMNGVSTRLDRWGNVLARYHHQPPASITPLVFTAHMDHPGFCSLRTAGPATSKRSRLPAAFRGWVEPEYFPGERVRFWHADHWIRGEITRITETAKLYRMIGRTARPEEVEVALDAPVPPGCPGMWDLPDPFEKSGNIHARGCDDIAGCASMIALLDRLSRAKARADVYCLFTRAEEVGFVGAIAAAKSGTIPRRLPIIAIETSKALPNARIGDGPILRVGDKTSIFTPELADFCNRVGMDLRKRKKSFAFQRKLMDGGTCESTAYYAYGYTATGMCVALGNYHNMNVEKKKIDTEYISLADWSRMVDYFEALVRARPGFGGEGDDRRNGLEKRFAEYRNLL